MNAEGLEGTLTSIESRLTSFEETVQGIDACLARVEGIVQEMSKGLTRLTWAVNLSGSVITVLLGIALAII
jgi:uncharacterized coiled-coil protein SlyX